MLLSAYFIYHSLNGRFGLESYQETREKSLHLEYQLIALKHKRESLNARVSLLKNGAIEKDMLDEQVRYHLNLIHRDEIVLQR